MLSLRLLGEPALLGPGVRLRFQREQRFRLLAYLAVQRRPVDRDQLAFVFWPDQPNDVARRNLRKAWFKLRRLPPLDGDAGLLADGGAMAWQVDSDLASWQAQLDAGALQQAAAAYGGPLLQGLDGGSTEFQRWLEMERERCHRLHRDSVLALLPTLAPADHGRALDWVASLADQDPLDEAVLRAQVRLLAAGGQLATARQCHARWRQRLQDELGVQAVDDVAELLAPAATPAPSIEAGRSRSRAPTYLSSFVGRRDELAVLEALLGGRSRVVTLLGPPGSGKTRLAVEAWHRLALPAFARRVFVELDILPADGGPPSGAQDFALHVAAAAGLALTEGEQAVDRLALFLATAPTLLVLDNLEHRLADLPLLRRLLQAPGLAVLVTSRARLGLDGEAVLDLGGLAAATTNTGDDALQLFEARCGRTLDGDARTAAAQLCQLLERQPLAIELAARQCRMLPPAELLRRVAADLDILSGGGDDLPPRQRSLRAAFETSWCLLPAALQQALSGVAVLRADFDASAARAVAGAGEAALAALADRSLLRVDPDSGRLRWHPFVRSFAIDRLACDAGAWTELRLRHASHFARLVQTLDLREEHPDPAALRQAALEIENLVDAWRHAVALGRPALWEPLAEALALHFEIHARYREGAEVLALCPLAAADAAAPQQRAAARVAVLRARLLHWADNDRADQLALAAAQICDRVDDDAGRIAAWRVRAVIAWRRGDATSAITIYRRALALCDSSGHAGKQAMLLDGLGLALIHAGDADASHAAFSRALELNEASGNGLQRVHNLVNLALDTQVRSPPQAMALARRALALAEEIGFDHYIPHCLTTLALAHLAAGDAVASRRLAGRAVAITHQSGDTYIESWAQAALARACLADGLWVDAANALVRGLDVSWRQRELGLVTQHLALAAEWLLQRGRFAAAHAVVHTLLAEAAVPSWLRHSLQALQARLPQAADAPRRQTLAALLHQLLGELAPPAPLS